MTLAAIPQASFGHSHRKRDARLQAGLAPTMAGTYAHPSGQSYIRFSSDASIRFGAPHWFFPLVGAAVGWWLCGIPGAVAGAIVGELLTHH